MLPYSLPLDCRVYRYTISGHIHSKHLLQVQQESDVMFPISFYKKKTKTKIYVFICLNWLLPIPYCFSMRSPRTDFLHKFPFNDFLQMEYIVTILVHKIAIMHNANWRRTRLTEHWTPFRWASHIKLHHKHTILFLDVCPDIFAVHQTIYFCQWTLRIPGRKFSARAWINQEIFPIFFGKHKCSVTVWQSKAQHQKCTKSKRQIITGQ